MRRKNVGSAVRKFKFKLCLYRQTMANTVVSKTDPDFKFLFAVKKRQNDNKFSDLLQTMRIVLKTDQI